MPTFNIKARTSCGRWMTICIYSCFKVICLFHILWPELSPPKHRNGQFYEILFYHIYGKTCLCWPLHCKLHYSSVFIFWKNKMLINSGQETYNGWHDRWRIELCSCQQFSSPSLVNSLLPWPLIGWLLETDVRWHQDNITQDKHPVLCLQCNKYWRVPTC